MSERTATWMLWVFGVAFLGLCSAGILGCGFGCDQVATCEHDNGEAGGSGSSGGEDLCPEDPVLGVVAAGCGIWAWWDGGDDSAPGTPSTPVKSITKAIDLAQSRGSTRIYACNATYMEAVRLPAGVSLFGGFSDCDKPTWSYRPYQPSEETSKSAVLAPGVPGMVLTLLAGDSMSFVGDLQIQASDAIEPGASSVAALALEDSRVTFRRCALQAGNGADGADGDPGDPNDAQAQKGLPGNGGIDACTMNPGLGGAQVTLHCDDGTTTIGGAGGDGGEGAATDGDDGELATISNPQGHGLGGMGQNVARGLACTGGAVGAHGHDGLDGRGGTALGLITADGQVIGGHGQDGTSGAPGQGGGGGGGAIGGPFCDLLVHGGAGGGSGGTGGCGGKGGKGGQAGGSSIGMVVFSKEVSFEDTLIKPGNGGNGGQGGVLQLGGQGGLPGLGGESMVFGVSGGCAGGAGGQGGKGGSGGGGRGGHSLAFARPNDVIPPGGFIVKGGTPGKGGRGGNQFILETNGNPGTNADSAVLNDP